MKRKYFLIILFLILAIFLTGCGLYNLNNFVMPDDLEFLALVDELDTPEKIGEYMLENFTLVAHVIYAPDPYTLWKIKEGDCNDFATFGMFIANWHGYETYLIKIFFEGTFGKHAIAVYVEDDGLSFTDKRHYLNNGGYYFNSFKEIVDRDIENYNYTLLDWKKYIVCDYWNNEVEVGYND